MKLNFDSNMKANKRDDVAEWYATQAFETCTTPTDKARLYLFETVEWMIKNLKDSAYAEIEEFYNEQMNNLEADGFFK